MRTDLGVLGSNWCVCPTGPKSIGGSDARNFLSCRSAKCTRIDLPCSRRPLSVCSIAMQQKNNVLSVEVFGDPKIKTDMQETSSCKLATIEFSWKSGNIPNEILLMIWDRARCGDPSLYHMRKRSVIEREPFDRHVGLSQTVLNHVEIHQDGPLSFWCGGFCETIGPRKSHTQFELFCESHPKVLCFGQFSFFAEESIAKSHLEDILKSLDVFSPDSWQ